MSIRTLGEAAILLGAVLLAWALPVIPPSTWALPSRLLRRFAATGQKAILWSAVVSFLACALFWSIWRPAPRIHDEFSYLLAADTFASFRLTNPTNPLWEHFESFHTIQVPSYQSKYPPGQGLFLAVGQVLTGRPIVGVWLSMAAAAAALCWMLLAWMPPRWALFGALLPTLRFGTLPVWDSHFFVYWSTTYWGGAVAMLGGALLFGALARLVRTPRPRDAAWLGSGLIVLANSRPFEGLVVGLAAAVTLLWVLARRAEWRSAVWRAIPAGAAVLTAGALAMGYYHYRVTGDPLRMPYQVHQDTYEVAPLFRFQEVNLDKPFRHEVLKGYALAMRDIYERREREFWSFLGFGFWGRMYPLYFFWGPALWVVLVWLLIPPWDARSAYAASVSILVIAAYALTMQPRLHFHYLAPIAPAFVAVAVAGLRRARTFRFGKRRLGRALAEAVIVVCSLSFFLGSIPRAIYGAPYQTPLTQYRPKFLEELTATGGKHLIIVTYGPGHNRHEEWVYNRADLDNTPVVWARDMGQEKNARLVDYYSDRMIWRLYADESPPRLVRYAEDTAPQ